MPIQYNPFTNNLDLVGTVSSGGGPINTINSQGPVGGNYTLTSTAGTITITNSAGNSNFEVSTVIKGYTSISSANSPYTVLATDYFISVDTSAGQVTINFPNAPTLYKTYAIKDRTGNAALNSIFLTTPGGVVTIDTVTSYKMEGNFESNELIFNGTSYEVF